MKMFRRIIAAVLFCGLNSLSAIEIVDVELQLLIDISGSVDSQEYALQMDGYKAAFESSTVQDAIIGGHYGKIAVQLIMWSGADQQQIMVDWALIDSVESANSFADQIAMLTRPFSGWTAIGSALSFAYPEFSTNDFDGTKQVIDISGDGTNNSGLSVQQARDEALAAGVDTINGIVITQDQAVIDQYAEEVVAGDSGFLLAPATFDDFQTAIENKIVAEIEGSIPQDAVVTTVAVPEPSSLLLFILAIIRIILFPLKGAKHA